MRRLPLRRFLLRLDFRFAMMFSCSFKKFRNGFAYAAGTHCVGAKKESFPISRTAGAAGRAGLHFSVIDVSSSAYVGASDECLRRGRDVRLRDGRPSARSCTLREGSHASVLFRTSFSLDVNVLFCGPCRFYFLTSGIALRIRLDYPS